MLGSEEAFSSSLSLTWGRLCLFHDSEASGFLTRIFLVNNTHSLWASLAHHTQAYIASTLLTKASSKPLIATVNCHQLSARSLVVPRGLVSLDAQCTISWWSGERGSCMHHHTSCIWTEYSGQTDCSILMSCWLQWRWIGYSWILVWQILRHRGFELNYEFCHFWARWPTLGFSPKISSFGEYSFH